MYKHFCFLLFAFFVLFKTFAQQAFVGEEMLSTKLDQYVKAHPDVALYLHCDKTIYTNNETIWFSAYLLKISAEQAKQHTLLSIALTREDSRNVFLQTKYLLQQGWSSGSISLPDSIPPGDYQLIATTNVIDKDGQPIALFTQPISIKSIKDQSFKASLSLLDTTVNSDGVIRARVMVTYPNYDSKEKKQSKLEYSVGKGGKLQSVNLKGYEHIITIPAERLIQSEPVLLTTIKYDGEVQHLSVKLPSLKADQIQVRFFPEGGNLVNGLESRVGWEAKTSYDQPIALRGVLLKDNLPVDTIETNKNGTGFFSLSPNNKSKYTLKLSANDYLSKDTVYSLPIVLETGVVLHLPKAVVNDTLVLNLSGTRARSVNILIHNYREYFASFVAQVRPPQNKVVVVLPEIPKGLATVTVLDEDLRPLAERIFFARYDQKISAQINPDKNVYAKKEKVNVGLTLTDEKGEPVNGIVSIAVVQDNRIEADKWQDIESYLFLTHDLGKLPMVPDGGRGFSNQQYLEEVLLVRGWRRFKWQNMIGTFSDSVAFASLPFISAEVKRNGKALKKAVILGTIRDSLIDLLNTEITGVLPFSPEQLLVKEGRKVFLMVNEKDKENYEIEIHDPYEKLHQQLSEKMEITSKGFVVTRQNSEELQLSGSEKSVTLQTVVVSTKKDNSIYGRGANACGDYVCMYNILNCPNHYNTPGSKLPVKGQQYRTPTGGSTIYGGCRGIDFYSSIIKGVYANREFYGVDTSPVAITEPQYLSTLFWEPGLAVSKNGASTFSFYTGDITGRFRIIVQGVTEEDAITGEHVFIVK